MATTTLSGKMASGTAVEPPVHFNDEPGTGLYRLSGGGLGLAVAGTNVASMTTSNITLSKAIVNTSNAGTAGTGVTAVESGDGVHMRVTMTLSGFAVGTSADNAALAVGAAIYTLPAGVYAINVSHLNVGVTIADANTAQTPEIGLGTTVGSGANATLGAVGAGAENIIEGAAVADCDGTAKVITDVPTANIPLVIGSTDSHVIYLNLAATWADMDAEAALTASGTVVLDYVKLA